MSVALAPWPKETLDRAGYDLKLPILGDSLTRRGESRPGEWGRLAWGLGNLVDVSQSPCFRAQRAMVKRIFFKNLKKYQQIQINEETHKQ